MTRQEILIIGTEDTKWAFEGAGFKAVDINDIENLKQTQAAAIVIDVRIKALSRCAQIIASIKQILGDEIGLLFAWISEEIDKPTYQEILAIGFDGIFNHDTPKEMINARLNGAIRLRNMREEVDLRFKSLGAFGASKIAPDFSSEKQIKVLIYAPPCPEALVYGTILDAMNISFVNAFSSFLAFDFLHNSKFDAIIIIAKDDAKSAMAFTGALRRNSRFFHLPCLVVAGPDFGDTELALSRGASDVSLSGLEDELSIARLMLAIIEKRRREALALCFAAAKTPLAIDNKTALYTKEFFNHHLQTLKISSLNVKKPISVGEVFFSLDVDKSSAINALSLSKIKAQVAAMVNRLVRVEDAACVVGEMHFAIIFPHSGKAKAEVAMGRICAVLASSAFDLEPTKGPVNLLVETKCFEV